jgi:SAM-dependent methyltransferase
MSRSRDRDLDAGDLDAMRAAWDGFAARDAMRYVDAARRDWDEDAFFASGAAIVAWALDWIGVRVEHGRMLEIGCGLGRTTVAFAAHFAQVDGVDISAAMLARARRRGLPANVRLTATSGADLRPLPDAAFDFVFCQHVLQHVSAEAVVAGYLDEVRRVLRPGGCALVQLDTRRRGALVRALGALPDALLPPLRRRHIRRHPRSPTRVRALVAAAGLAVEDERDQGTAVHWLLLALAGAATGAVQPPALR